jgi:hypothetical protein
MVDPKEIPKIGYCFFQNDHVIATLVPKQRNALTKDLNTSAFVSQGGRAITVKKVKKFHLNLIFRIKTNPNYLPSQTPAPAKLAQNGLVMSVNMQYAFSRYNFESFT